MVEEWKQIIAQSITKPEQVRHKFNVNVRKLKTVVSQYPMRISKYYFDLIEEVDDPIWKQCVPSPLELQDPHGLDDPLNEEEQSPVPGLVHRYPDRVLMCVSNSCATYCRFCTRKRKVGNPVITYSRERLLQQIQYIKKTSAIRDVLLSGGDPFMLSDERIEFLLQKLRTIPHVEILRIGSRVPCTLPQRITPKLCSILKKYPPIYVNVHFNHPLEITEDSARACGLLADAGIPLASQSVLLRGVNDDPVVMKNLFQKLLTIRVRPYYIFQIDLVRGTYHFRTPVETGLNILASLIGHTSGLAVPRYVIDSPGGGGKIPIQPNYIQSIDEDKIVLRNYEGKTYAYPQNPLTEKTPKQRITP
ncbi:MAG: KamA family radical SAM protein [Candidatus Bathyarchaeota archaeon]|nr:KamA family radical SAM protein [Candidatus Bathyarchaeota archaeon]